MIKEMLYKLTWFADTNLCLNFEKTETGLFSLKEKDEGKYFKLSVSCIVLYCDDAKHFCI